MTASLYGGNVCSDVSELIVDTVNGWSAGKVYDVLCSTAWLTGTLQMPCTKRLEEVL